jgi:Mg2+ and Co2+ transporter CorA
MRAFNLSDKGVYSQTKNWKSAEWIHVENPDSDDVADLMSTFGIPMDYILDSLDEYEIPRQERVNNGPGIRSICLSSFSLKCGRFRKNLRNIIHILCRSSRSMTH